MIIIAIIVFTAFIIMIFVTIRTENKFNKRRSKSLKLIKNKLISFSKINNLTVNYNEEDKFIYRISGKITGFTILLEVSYYLLKISIGTDKESTFNFKIQKKPDDIAGILEEFKNKSKTDMGIGDRYLDNVLLFSNQDDSILLLLDDYVLKYIEYLLVTTDLFELTETQFISELRYRDEPDKNINIKDFLNLITELYSYIKKLNSQNRKELLLNSYYKTGNEKIKKCILSRLVLNYKNDNQIKDILKGLLNHHDFDIEIMAAEYLNMPEKLIEIIIRASDIFKIRALSILLKIGNEENINSLLQYFKNDSEHVSDLLNEIEKSCNPAANVLLINLLKLSDNTDILISVIKALGACGSIEAVEPLLNLKKNKNIILYPEINNAVKEIQSRLQDAEKGQLSVAENNLNVGSLSIIDEDE
jgi:hypothetical protein